MPKPVRTLLVASLAVLALPGTASATDPASRFDAPGQRHADECVPLSTGAAALRYGDGTPTGFNLTADQLAYDLGSCPSGTATLDLHELIPSGAGPLAFHRGGSGYVDRGNVKYGDLAVSDLAGPLPAPVPSSGGRGAPCTLAPEPPYQVDVRAISSRMHYKPDGGASYVPYGDPAASQGENDGSIHYTYLLWSWIDVAGGGTVRTLLAPGQIVRACDVASITSPSYDSDGQVNGAVTARYVETLAGTCPVYGWMVWSHTLNGSARGSGTHVTAMSGAPPPDPVPDPACPVAEAASPPVVATGAARAATSGPVLTGAVNPKGVPTTYAFQVGATTAYGASTPTRSLGSDDQDEPVSAAPAGLRPGVKLHYRLVAANTHGVSYGPDRTLTPPKLKRLRVRVKANRIEFRLSAPATVRITFARISGKRRVPVRGAIVRKLRRGRASLHVPHRLGKLRRGRYVATVVPRGKHGLAGRTAARRFTRR